MRLTIDSLPWSHPILTLSNTKQLKKVIGNYLKMPDYYIPGKNILTPEPVIDHYETRTREVTKKRVSGSESYVSGYNDLGNGYFRRSYFWKTYLWILFRNRKHIKSQFTAMNQFMKPSIIMKSTNGYMNVLWKLMAITLLPIGEKPI